MKTHRATAKRFRITRTGKVLHRKATGNHMLTKKTRQPAAPGGGHVRGQGRAHEHPPAAREVGRDGTGQDSVHAKKKRREVLRKAKGYYGSRSRRYRVAKEQLLHSGPYAYRDRRDRKAPVPPAVDHADRRGCATERPVVLPVHARPAEGRDRASTARSWRTWPSTTRRRSVSSSQAAKDALAA